MFTLKKCRLCNCKNLISVINLGRQINTSIFPKIGKLNKVESYSVNLLMCKECGLVQIDETTPPDLMYKTGNYGYKSSISNTMRTHLKNYHDEILSKKKLNKNDIVLDIGCNDSTFLHFYDDNIRRIGCDPTGEQFKEFYNDMELLPDYFTKENIINKFGDIKFNIITSICMFYDLPDPVQFAKDIHDLLHDDGIWTCEQSYLLTMLKTNSIDTICHEHLEYYALTQIKEIADRANLKIIDIKFNDSNGGSFRIYFAKKNCSVYNECTDLINRILQQELDYKIKDPQTYMDFVSRCDNELNKLQNMLRIIKKNNKKAYLLGASTKGNCVLQYCNIIPEDVPYAVERNRNKIGCVTNTNIEIISEETMRSNPPDYLIVLPWHFKKEIIERENEFLKNGGQFIFYFPTFEIISYKPKTLITGCDGFIANFVKKELKDHTLYGITKTQKTIENNITKTFFDMTNYDELRNFIETVNPDNIVHLASTSSTVDAFNNPFNTLQNNGMLCAKLCEIIKNMNKNIKLFNASSSEIYKGHIEYNVDEYSEENLNNTYHLHPYSIAKILSNQIVKFYRKEYGLPFSNGIIFTTQSKEKSNKFLLNKIKTHIENWLSGEKNVLNIGGIDSFRNIIHPHDVATAINKILTIDEGTDYLICNYNSCKISDLVLKIYENNNIDLVRGVKNNVWYEKDTNKEVICINDSQKGLDTKAINIKGYPCRLRYHEWKIKYSIEDILNEFII
tara:strand:- start:4171 stop:6369 length:2199 start_codon:yes stop_codon:yes gene_type:complete